MTEREELLSYIYEANKDVHGFKDRSGRYDDRSLEELRDIADQMSKDVQESIELEESAQAIAVTKFEARVSAMMADNNISYDTAVRWISDAEDCDGDLEHLCYTYNLPYNYFNKKENV